MDLIKKRSIENLVDNAIDSFAKALLDRYTKERFNSSGVINMKKKNCFIAELGQEFMFYSALVRSFDSSFGNTLERLGNDIAKLSYTVKGDINSFILPEQTQRIASILDNYSDHTAKPSILHYCNFDVIYPRNISSFKRNHVTDHYFFSPEKNEHYLIELKASGDLDNKKSRAEKSALLEEYFLLKNALKDDSCTEIKIFFATAYNKYGEGNTWKQERVLQYFADEELLIGRDYWNFVCNDDNGFDIIFEQYKQSADKIKKTLNQIKDLYS